ncbi:mitochondrial import inner membrane translocase subunit Tim13 [Drosophila sechellia]|uniref:Mitochondrial import inner membrane translocase subunit n=1 Tax=Drosophila sechellia TaxID=7238 RepID=B4HEY6_DROSE|nr:mitochondrial import inner membrane translocase subunit Tim13 [Drosophila sechellia]EDW41155.1 GM24714 [Drosophila sechellia]
MAAANMEKGELMNQVKQQIALANAQEMLSKMTEKCFKKCIQKPGKSLDSTEQRCISQCMDRFMDAWNLVSRTYGNRLQREQYRSMDSVEEMSS